MLKARSTCTTSPSVQLSMYHLVTSSFSNSCTVKLLIIIIIIMFQVYRPISASKYTEGNRLSVHDHVCDGL